ncbi:MAG: serine protease [bacterium]|nr:serine protease [bacterium]
MFKKAPLLALFFVMALGGATVYNLIKSREDTTISFYLPKSEHITLEYNLPKKEEIKTVLLKEDTDLESSSETDKVPSLQHKFPTVSVSEPLSGTDIQLENSVTEKKEDEVDFQKLNLAVRQSIVNIICTTKFGGYFAPTSGSGTVVSPNGVILTAAHLAQYFLLKDYPVENFIECVVRTGSPASPAYTARLLYLPPDWIENNATNLTEENLLSTGENDFAFLLITGRAIKDKTVPEPLPFLPYTEISTEVPGDSVLISGYPAGFLDGIAIQKDLYLTSSFGQIDNLYSFTEGSVDVISIFGNIISQKGVSGGAVVNLKGELSGVLVTATENPQTSERYLNAITLPYINRALEEQDLSIGKILSSPESVADNFNREIAPSLKKILVDSIEKR